MTKIKDIDTLSLLTFNQFLIDKLVVALRQKEYQKFDIISEISDELAQIIDEKMGIIGQKKPAQVVTTNTTKD